MVETKRRITISVDKVIIDKYKKYCKEKGFKVSSQLERFIKQHMEKND